MISRPARGGVLIALVLIAVLGVPLALPGLVAAAGRPTREQALVPPVVPFPGAVTYRLYATREGLVGRTTANGHVIQPRDRFVALPSRRALSSKGGREKQVLVTYKGRSATAPVWDVGPWNIKDNYWDPPELRETGKGLPRGWPAAQGQYFDGYMGGISDKSYKVVSPAGIDLADGLFWDDLGMTDSDWVDVTFLWLSPLASYLAQPLPPAALARVAPFATTHERRYFPETGHGLSGAFMRTWEGRGGLPVFGYPLTEPVEERSLDDGKTYTVQYFERARLELHPENAGTPSEVLLGFLGKAFHTPDPPATQLQGARYFPETGHNLKGDFRAYWEANGGLSLFGLPISEELKERSSTDGKEYTVQWFERARFEYHPENKAPYTVLLGQLGRQLIDLRAAAR